MPDCRRKAQNSAALMIASGVRAKCVKTAAWIECVIETSQASNGADTKEFSTDLVMRNLGDDDDRAGCQDRLEPYETSYDMRLAGSADNHAERPAVSRINRAMIDRDLRRVSDGAGVRRDRAWLLPCTRRVLIRHGQHLIDERGNGPGLFGLFLRSDRQNAACCGVVAGDTAAGGRCAGHETAGRLRQSCSHRIPLRAFPLPDSPRLRWQRSPGLYASPPRHGSSRPAKVEWTTGRGSYSHRDRPSTNDLIRFD